MFRVYGNHRFYIHMELPGYSPPKGRVSHILSSLRHCLRMVLVRIYYYFVDKIAQKCDV